MPTCRNCGNHVTVQFARVFGDNEDDVYNCIDCATNAELGDAAATRGQRAGSPEWRA